MIAMLEMAVAQKTPVMEAEHAIDDTNRLCFFDCLIPKLKEKMKLKIKEQVDPNKQSSKVSLTESQENVAGQVKTDTQTKVSLKKKITLK